MKDNEYSLLAQELSRSYDAIPEVITMPGYFYPVVTQFLGRVDNKHVTDLGCGNGYLLRQIRDANPQALLTGVDFSAVLLSNAHARVPGGQFTQADLNRGLPLATESQDVVVITEVIEHLVNSEILLSEAQRVLKKCGECILTFPNVDGWLLYRLLGELLPNTARRLPCLMLFVPGEHHQRTRQPIDAMLHYREVLAQVSASGFIVEEAAGYEALPDIAAIKGIRHIDYFHPRLRLRLSKFITKVFGAQLCYRVFLRCRKKEHQ